MKKTTHTYEFFYCVMSNVNSEESDKRFSYDGVCLKHALIKFSEHLASFSDYSSDKYVYLSSYLLDNDLVELLPDDITFLEYYIQYSLLYKKAK